MTKASEIIKDSCCGQLLDVPVFELVAKVEKLERENESYRIRVCQMCDGHGMIGNILDSIDCPDCVKANNLIKAESIDKLINEVELYLWKHNKVEIHSNLLKPFLINYLKFQLERITSNE